MKKVSLLFVLLLSTVFVNAQVNQGEFLFDGGYMNANALVQTNDRGYLVAGNSTYSGWGFYLVKLDSSGNIQWSENIIDSVQYLESGLVKTSDGGYALAGFTPPSGTGGQDAFITRLDSSGNIQWAKRVGGSNNDWAGQLFQTADKGFLLFGSTQSFRSGSFTDLYMVKFDSAGNLKWTKTIRDSSNYVSFECATASIGGGYIVVNSNEGLLTNSLTYNRIDDNGNVLWRHNMQGQYIGSQGGALVTSSIIQMKNGDYVTFASQNVWHQSWVNGLVIITDSLCTKDSIMVVPLGSRSSQVSMNGGIATNDGGFAFTGSINNGDSMFAVKADSNAMLQWHYIEPGIAPPYTSQFIGNAIIQTKGNGYAIAGDNNLPWSPGLQWYWGYMYKLDDKGNGCRYTSSPISWNGAALHTASFPSISDSAGTGGVVDTINFKIYTGLEYDSIVCRVLGYENINNPVGNFKIYPNPATYNLTIDVSAIVADKLQLTITNELGQTIYVRQLSLTSNTVNVNTTTYKSGLYFISFKTSNGMVTKKFVKL